MMIDTEDSDIASPNQLLDSLNGLAAPKTTHSHSTEPACMPALPTQAELGCEANTLGMARHGPWPAT